MKNVISIKPEKTPVDLMSFNEFAQKYSMKVCFLYKLHHKGKFKRYKRGVWKISESEVLRALDRIA